jgi:hypothetical protein
MSFTDHKDLSTERKQEKSIINQGAHNLLLQNPTYLKQMRGPLVVFLFPGSNPVGCWQAAVRPTLSSFLPTAF